MLAFDRLGAGAPLVLLHPLGADRGVWEPVLEPLARRFDVIAPDLPGFGASPVLGEPATPAALARAVAALLGELGVRGAAAAGNSLGGWVAFELGLLGAVRSVTGIAPAGLWAGPLAPRPGTARRLARLALPLLPGLARSRRGRRLLLAGSVAHPDRVPPAAAERLVRSYATAPGLQDANAHMRASHFTRLAELDVPVTVAWCERDRLVGRRPLPATVRQVVLRDCGHIPMWDDPQAVVDLLVA